MEMRRIGATGLRVSAVGLGCNNFGGRLDEAATRAVVHAALDAGITLFDTADVYGGARSESLLGASLAGKRHEVVIATKFGGPMGEGALHRGASRRHVVAAVDASLRRLGTDYIDLYQQHFPDPDTPVDETLRALDDLVRSGKVRYVGHSNFSGWQIADADWQARLLGSHRFVSAQNNYSLLERRVEREVVPACERFGIALLPYFPLASGLLTGKYRRGEPPPAGSRLANAAALAERALTESNLVRVESIAAFAAERELDLLDVAFGWLLSRPVVCSVIAGATSPAQLRANVAAGQRRLSAADVTALDALTKRRD